MDAYSGLSDGDPRVAEDRSALGGGGGVAGNGSPPPPRGRCSRRPRRHWPPLGSPAVASPHGRESESDHICVPCPERGEMIEKTAVCRAPTALRAVATVPSKGTCTALESGCDAIAAGLDRSINTSLDAWHAGRICPPCFVERQRVAGPRLVCRSVCADLPESCPQKARALCYSSAPGLPIAAIAPCRSWRRWTCQCK